MPAPGNINRYSLASTATRTVSEIVQLFADRAQDREELEIKLGIFSLEIVKHTYRDGAPESNTDTQHVDLRSQSVLLRYTVSDKTDLSSQWAIAVVRGKAPEQKIIEYPLKSEEDAFRFQRLVTGYYPHSRFQRVVGSALDGIHWTRRTTDIEIFGEAQLWYASKPGSFGDPSLLLRRTQTGLSAETLTTTSALSTTSTPHTETFQPAPYGRETKITTPTPPLLIFFAKSVRGKKVRYRMMKVDISKLECTVLKEDSKRLKLLVDREEKVKTFWIYVLKVKREVSWSLYHLRPTASSPPWKPYESSELELVFENGDAAAHFKHCFDDLLAQILGINVSTPGSPRTTIRSSTSSILRRPPDGPVSLPTIITPRDGNEGDRAPTGSMAPPGSMAGGAGQNQDEETSVSERMSLYPPGLRQDVRSSPPSDRLQSPEGGDNSSVAPSTWLGSYVPPNFGARNAGSAPSEAPDHLQMFPPIATAGPAAHSYRQSVSGMTDQRYNIEEYYNSVSVPSLDQRGPVRRPVADARSVRSDKPSWISQLRHSLL